MDPDVLTKSPDKLDAKPSFRKPTNDAGNRKYRRHSPLGRSDSASSGSPKRERSHSPVNSAGDHRRKDDVKELERDSNRYRSSKRDDSRRHSERSTYGNSHGHRRNNDYSRYERHGDEDDRIYQRSSRSVRESRSGSRNDHSRDNWRDDKYTRDKPEVSGHRTKDKERETIPSENYRNKDRDSERARIRDSERAASGSIRQINSTRDNTRTEEREKYAEREAREDKRDRYKNDHASHDLGLGGEGVSLRSKEPNRRNNREMDGQKDDLVLKRRHDVRETEKLKEKYTRESKEEMPNNKLKLGHSEGDEKPSSSLKQVSETAAIATSKPFNSGTNQVGSASDLDAAKIAAMRAAELVNKNLVGSSYLSTDQKKKLLWGNKKNTMAEESQPANRWDLQLFSDKERQEKFNKLMSLRLPWYIWPIVGCEGGRCPRAQSRRQGCRKAERAAQHGPGKAVHSRTPTKRWPDCWPWPVRMIVSVLFNSYMCGMSFKCFEALLSFQL